MSFQEKIKAGQFVVLGEFSPPKGADFSELLAAAQLVRGRVDAIVVPELAVAVLKASSLGGCAFLQNHGFETVFQVLTRDRNRLALQADLLSAAALGVRNVMVLQGEDIHHGDHILAREVQDLDLIMLLEAIQGLVGGKDMAGVPVSPAPTYFVGADFDAGTADALMEGELEKLRKKVALGVKYVVTNPVFDLRRLEGYLKRLAPIGVAVIPTVLVLKSAGMAKYVNRNVRNISIPTEIISRLDKATDRPREGIKIAGELVARMKSLGMAGVLVSTRGWEDRLPQILDVAGL